MKALLQETRMIYRNFSGKASPYNREGDRNFCVVLRPEEAASMLADGWAVKTKPPRQEGDDPLNYIKVTVSYKVKPPRVILISSTGKNTLDEGTLHILDFADVEKIDVAFTSSKWDMGNRSGISAYLDAIYVTLREDELEAKYRDTPFNPNFDPNDAYEQ